MQPRHTPFYLFYFFREREMELYGPKKRGPKPKTFLLKVCCVLQWWSVTFKEDLQGL